MKIIGHVRKLPAHGLKFFDGEIKKVLVIRLEADLTALFQNDGVAFQKITIGEAALGMALLRRFWLFRLKVSVPDRRYASCIALLL